MIKFQNVSKTYNGNVKAVKDVSFNIEAGEFVILIGPSGCGKTSLLRMVNQLETITEGDIVLNGKSVRDFNKIEMRRKMGYVIQSNGLFPNMTIEDNVMIVPNLLGWDKVKKRQRYQYLMDLIGLNPDEYKKRYPHQLSGGQQQRIGVARALAADPPIMLMDEPFGALDPIIRTRLQDEFLQIQREVQKTILFVSHDIDEAVKMGDKIALMRHGELIQYDTPANILLHPRHEFVSEFVGEDRVLKSMSLYTVKDLLESITLDTNVSSTQQTVHEQTTLRNALSVLFSTNSQKIKVVDIEERPIGTLTIDQIEQFLQLKAGQKGA